MQLKSLLYVASALVVGYAQSTPSDILTSVTTGRDHVMRLQQAIADFPQTGGMIVQVLSAIKVHNELIALTDAGAAAIPIAQNFKGEMTVENGTQILQMYRAMRPVIQSATDTVIANKGIVSRIPLRGGTTIAKAYMVTLLSACIDYHNAFIPIIPPSLQGEFVALVDAAHASVNRAIQEYSS